MAAPSYQLVVRLRKVATGLLSVLWQAAAMLICGHRSCLRLIPGCLKLRVTERIPLEAILNVGGHGMRATAHLRKVAPYCPPTTPFATLW